MTDDADENKRNRIQFRLQILHNFGTYNFDGYLNGIKELQKRCGFHAAQNSNDEVKREKWTHARRCAMVRDRHPPQKEKLYMTKRERARKKNIHRVLSIEIVA